MTARPECQHGVTLIELVISMVIISVALVGVLSVMNLTVSHSADPLLQRQAVAIAESYLEEISLKAYSGASNGAANCGSVNSPNRANYDDVGDYNGLSDQGVCDQSGTAVSSLSQYNVSVAVTAATLTGAVAAKQISVSVSGAGVSGVTLVGYRAQY